MEFYVRAILLDYFSKVLIVVVQVRGGVQAATTVDYVFVLWYGICAIRVLDGA